MTILRFFPNNFKRVRHQRQQANWDTSNHLQFEIFSDTKLTFRMFAKMKCVLVCSQTVLSKWFFSFINFDSSQRGKNANEFRPFSKELINKWLWRKKYILPKFRCATTQNTCSETKKEYRAITSKRNRCDKWLEKRINKKPVPFFRSILSGYDTSPTKSTDNNKKEWNN